ncbi:hypothetical protein RRG08_023977 [Elysia crispata]|uniref:Uncharacterized protein n=1 Tax=Elysia crispata TaxID=231223 RepID=A0AAE0YMJ7_9GAST|nr:hypothetical protein RRG08_023977 [Elysia crispata]
MVQRSPSSQIKEGCEDTIIDGHVKSGSQGSPEGRALLGVVPWVSSIILRQFAWDFASPTFILTVHAHSGLNNLGKSEIFKVG